LQGFSAASGEKREFYVESLGRDVKGVMHKVFTLNGSRGTWFLVRQGGRKSRADAKSCGIGNGKFSPIGLSLDDNRTGLTKSLAARGQRYATVNRSNEVEADLRGRVTNDSTYDPVLTAFCSSARL
jgi:hypothetical protein